MTTLYDGLVKAIDQAKTDDRSLDTDEYAAIALADLPDPLTVAQKVLDAHAIKPDWRRTGEQILHLIAEGIAEATGQPVPSKPTDQTVHSIAEDEEFLADVIAVLPTPDQEFPMPFVEVAQRVRNSGRGYTPEEVRGALVALEAAGRAEVLYGHGWQRTDR